MDLLIQKSDRKIREISMEITRYLLPKINTNNRISIIKGARGSGKTTLLLQYAKKFATTNKATLYVALDDLFFKDNTLYHLAEEFVKNNGGLLLLDEVHKYPNWSRELKLIYDDFKDLKLLVTSSSLLEIYKSESDLSRRAIVYNLKELSFREFLMFEKKLKLPSYNLEELINNHIDISYTITSKIKPIYEFNKYIKQGMYPYYWENKIGFEDTLLQTIHLALEVDLPAVEALDYVYIVKLKKLLYAISTSAPFTPNITKLSERVGISRKALIKAFHYLERARLLILLEKNNKGISILSKPDKIFINNPNLQHVLGVNYAQTGTLRESFFVNQLEGIYKIKLPKKGDFIVNDIYTFEVGGKNKSKSQLKGVSNSFLVKDNIENGTAGTIPLWLFGFLY
ncbi:MAG: AAA family ATPase [Flavobacteriaceae bacterium]|nr:MAG: AAA family ATPase [Flavobacteriaceae bacterium]